ncbi:MAG: BppU family phage baseplate upper protein [Terrisporobacter sp.]
MAVKEFKFNLDIEKEDYIPRFKVKQYDTAIFYVNLLKNGTPFPITNETIKIFAKKSDGKLIYQEDEISIENGLIKINVKNQAFTSPGLAYAELELKSNTGQVTTATFIYEVREKVGSDKAVESVTDISTLEKIDKYVEEAKKELDKFKNDLSKLEDLVANKDKLEGQNTEAKVNISELEKVLDQANNIVSDEGKKVVGNNVLSDGVTNGYVQDIRLTGKTLVNEILSRANFNGSDKTVYTNIKLQKGKLYANKTYTYIPLGVPSKCDSMYLGTSDSTMVAIRNAPVKPTTFILPRDALENELLPHFYGADFTLDDFINTKLLILEGDHTKNPPSYFESVKSVGDGTDNIEVSSCNENLFNGIFENLHIEGGTNILRIGSKGTVGFILKVPQNTDLYMRAFDKHDRDSVGFSVNKPVAGDVLQNINIMSSTGKIINTGIYNYVVVYVSSNYEVPDVIISMNKVDSYTPHKSNKKKLVYKDIDGVWKKPILREWDTIEQHSDGKYYYRRRSEETVLDGTQTVYLGNVVDDTTAFTIVIPNQAQDNSLNVICDKMLVNLECYSQPIEGLFVSSNSCFLRINSSKANTIETLKTCLSTKPITIVYQMAQEEVYECLDISVRSFRDETMLSINAGPIDPGVEYYLPSSFVSADNSLSSKLENTDSELINLMFDYLGHNHDSRYFTKSESDQRYPLIYASDVTDFNTCLTEGVHSVGSSSDLPNAPYIDPGMGIYGTLEVLKKKNEYIQRFTSNICKMFVRFRNYAGVWSSWNKAISDKDFQKEDASSPNALTVFPDGTCIQRGQISLTFDGSHVDKSGYIYYAIPFKEGSSNVCTGNVASNNWAGYSDLVCSVAADNQSRGFATMRRIDGQIPGGDRTVQINWIAIGRV